MDQSEMNEIIIEIREIYVSHHVKLMDVILISELIKLMAYNGDFGKVGD